VIESEARGDVMIGLKMEALGPNRFQVRAN
jgi:hypothetical protein